MGRCAAITKAGVRCKASAAAGGTVCRRHERSPRLASIITVTDRATLPDARALFAPHATEARDCIIALMSSENERVALSAAKEVLGYAYGQAKADVEVSVNGDVDLAQVFEGFSKEDLREIARGALRGKDAVKP
jgi:hypothetical protein